MWDQHPGRRLHPNPTPPTSTRVAEDSYCQRESVSTIMTYGPCIVDTIIPCNRRKQGLDNSSMRGIGFALQCYSVSAPGRLSRQEFQPDGYDKPGIWYSCSVPNSQVQSTFGLFGRMMTLQHASCTCVNVTATENEHQEQGCVGILCRVEATKPSLSRQGGKRIGIFGGR